MSTFELLVGDVLMLATGDILPADGLLLQGSDLRYGYRSGYTCRAQIPLYSYIQPFPSLKYCV